MCFLSFFVYFVMFWKYKYLIFYFSFFQIRSAFCRVILVLAHKTIADGPISLEVLADSLEPWQRKFYCSGNLLNSQIYNVQSYLTTRIKFTGDIPTFVH